MNERYCWQPSEGQSEISRLLFSLEQEQFFKVMFFSILYCLFRIRVHDPQMHCIFGNVLTYWYVLKSKEFYKIIFTCSMESCIFMHLLIIARDVKGTKKNNILNEVIHYILFNSSFIYLWIYKAQSFINRSFKEISQTK